MTQDYRAYYADDGLEIEVISWHDGLPSITNSMSFDPSSGGYDLNISQLPEDVTELKIELVDGVGSWQWDFSCIEPGNEVSLATVYGDNDTPTIHEGDVVSQSGGLLTIDLSALPAEATHIRFNQ